MYPKKCKNEHILCKNILKSFKIDLSKESQSYKNIILHKNGNYGK